ncbi:MAG: hypothetical protein GWN01_08565 [Nitrosopumilaceae archaeon]|nr:hypothetical protein [Nitrosopumilaceae archaeon]NIU00967.1 hypothetical protein [Nitrosopumilaceae archaeon]NIU87732.1 hypothetical protein [Nitrosopumilaceae archaeon]NIX61569.1 hypothetical protein [Nitrosopumilaceae archaeon]
MSWITDTWISNTDFDKFRYPASAINNFTEIIELSTEKYLKRLLGIELYSLFNDNFTNNTNTVRFSSLRDGEIFEKQNGDTWEFEGLKEMCQLFAMYEEKQNPYGFNEIGISYDAGNNEDRVNSVVQKQIANKLYADARTKYWNVKYYLLEKIDIFPEWKFSEIENIKAINY